MARVATEVCLSEFLNGRVDVGHRLVEVAGKSGNFPLCFRMIMNQRGNLHQKLPVIFARHRLHKVAEQVSCKRCRENADSGIIAFDKETKA